MKTLFWPYLIFLLLGYQFLGKGFAYLGHYPVFVGEIGVALGVLSLLLVLITRGRLYGKRLASAEVILLILFLIWSTVRTIPFIPVYSFTTLRDAALFGYSAFAVLIILLMSGRRLEQFLGIYGGFIPIFLLWLPILYVVRQVIGFDYKLPGSDVSLLWVKFGDAGVHLGMVGAYLLLRLDRFLKSRPWNIGMILALWMLWGGAWIVYGTQGRAGMVAALLGVFSVILMRPKTRWDRPLLLGVVLIVFLMATNLQLTSSKQGVNISFDQLTANVVSLVAEGEGRLESTKEWRLDWWKEIINYTFAGRYFWIGKGYGVNLAVADGFENQLFPGLRSPHNVFMTILARSGVPGFVLWCLFLLSLCVKLIWGIFRSMRANLTLEAYVLMWLLASLLAFLFNASFDVFLEGPMGGIWFWSLAGFAIVYSQHSLRRSRLVLSRKWPTNSGSQISGGPDHELRRQGGSPDNQARAMHRLLHAMAKA